MKKIKIILKQNIVLLMLVSILSANVQFAYASIQDNTSNDSSKTLQGSVETQQQVTDPKIFTGKNALIKEGTKLKMTVSQVISSSENSKDDEFFAEVADDLSTTSGVTIPAGTLAHGKVSKLVNSKRLGRDGYLTLDFDYLITPDGRQIPIVASMTTKRNAVSSTAKVVLEDVGYTAAGGIIGGLLAVKYFGIGATIASHGYLPAGFAAVGATVGLGASLSRKGEEKLIAPGDIIKVKITSKLDLPVMTEEAFKQKENLLPGLDVKIVDYKLEKDPFGELNTITLTLNIDNKTNRTFSTFDLALVNDYKSQYYASPFDNTDMFFQKIAPNTKIESKLSFSVDNPRRKHWLVFYDSMSRKELAKISVDNAERRIKKDNQKDRAHS